MLRAGADALPDFMGRNLIRDQRWRLCCRRAGTSPTLISCAGAFSCQTRCGLPKLAEVGGANAALCIDGSKRNICSFHWTPFTEVQGVARKAWNVATRPFEMLRITSELIGERDPLRGLKESSGGLHGKSRDPRGVWPRARSPSTARIGAKTRAMSLISAFQRRGKVKNGRFVPSARKPGGHHQNHDATNSSVHPVVVL